MEIAALGHNYQSSFSWDDLKATLTLTCTNNSLHILTFNAEVSSEIIKEASSEEPGLIRYTASYTHNGRTYTDYKEVEYTYVSGDLDGDNKINTSDVIYLLMYTYFPNDYPINQPCDYTGDGVVNTNDVIHLLMYTYFPDSYPITITNNKREEEEE